MLAEIVQMMGDAVLELVLREGGVTGSIKSHQMIGGEVKISTLVFKIMSGKTTKFVILPV